MIEKKNSWIALDSSYDLVWSWGRKKQLYTNIVFRKKNCVFQPNITNRYYTLFLRDKNHIFINYGAVDYNYQYEISNNKFVRIKTILCQLLYDSKQFLDINIKTISNIYDNTPNLDRKQGGGPLGGTQVPRQLNNCSLSSGTTVPIPPSVSFSPLLLESQWYST